MDAGSRSFAATPAPGAHRRADALYAALLAAGVALPFSQFLPWLAAHGLDVPRFVADLFANRIGAFFGWDVVVSVLTLLALAAFDRELPGRQRLSVALASMLGASVGLPLYLLLRERRRGATR
jgi:hypothetical protein